ncbi:alpha/beta hydrolase [soil metagenome]
MQAVLDQLVALGAQPLATLTPAQARQQPAPPDAVKRVLEQRGASTDPESVGNVDNRNIPGPDGNIAVRIYSPSGSGPFPVILYIHGGGWVIADLDTYDASARALTNAANAVVISAHYRQAPEHKFPAAHEDVWAAYRWTLQNAGDLGGDPRRVAVAGESAGGNLAMNISIRARDEGVQLPVHQLLVYPVAGNDLNTPSYLENTAAAPLGRPGMIWFAEHVVRTPNDMQDPRINLLGANVQGLPPTTIIAAQIDPLRSEGEQLAERLQSAGVPVERRQWDGVTHEFFGMAAVVPKAREAVQFAGQRLRAAFGR